MAPATLAQHADFVVAGLKDTNSMSVRRLAFQTLMLLEPATFA
jgi:hypothetical protein|tara:strand:+ start:1029 stop:1157 length:129 start_codon:yes stop_codon:yes gene_type:complete